MRRPPVIAPRRPARSRTSTTKFQHLYNTQRWKRASKAFRARPENALCRPCRARGKIVASAAVDHIKPHRGDEHLFWSEDNWQPICASCHSAKSLADSTEARTGKPMLQKGCTPDGFPLDLRHPWWSS